MSSTDLLISWPQQTTLLYDKAKAWLVVGSLTLKAVIDR